MENQADNCINNTQNQTITISNTAIYKELAKAFDISTLKVASFASLYDDGHSIPFIARYRKDKTGGLDDVVLRNLEKALVDARDLAVRRIKIKQNIGDKLTHELAEKIDKATTKAELNEIYTPYRIHKRSLASKAALAGLLPFAKRILAGEAPKTALADYQPVTSVRNESGESFEVNYSTYELQAAGVTAIILDEWSKSLDLLDEIRTNFNATASISSKLISEDKQEVGEKFKDYFDHKEPFSKLSHHRLLAMLRGRQQNILVLSVIGEDTPFIDKIIAQLVDDKERGNQNREFLVNIAQKLWHDRWRSHIENRLLTEKRLLAQSVAIDVFANNLKYLLLNAPAPNKVILGVDPGIRHGVKMAVIDATGNVIDHKTAYPFTPYNKTEEAKDIIKSLIINNKVDLVAIGNGTASRETDALIKEIIKDHNLSATAFVVSEAGASVYSASEIASEELPDLDVSVRGAVSIARRVQDPLSELVKVEPKAIGVGQYQHDVNQSETEERLDKVTKDCVNLIGVDVNTASPSLLTHIAGLNKNVAQQIVNYRSQNGAFGCRNELKNVPRLGDKTFLQAAGFLRIKEGNEPLDSTGVHPESYGDVYALLNKHNINIADAIGNVDIINNLLTNVEPSTPQAYALAELAKSRHDPRGEFTTVKFSDDINSIQDLTVGMELEGVITNVTAFGCFVDVGVHTNGLVHISEMADDFVGNPTDIVKPLDIVKVRVISIDEKRGRVGLSMKKHNPQTTNNTPRSDTKKPEIKPKKPFVKKDKKPSKQKQHSTHLRSDDSQKIGSFGALLKQAGL